MIALRPVSKCASLRCAEWVQLDLRNKAVVDVKWLALLPLEVVSGMLLRAKPLAGESLSAIRVSRRGRDVRCGTSTVLHLPQGRSLPMTVSGSSRRFKTIYRVIKSCLRE
jgi:hypothetical protein